jgi:hypothetical protein
MSLLWRGLDVIRTIQQHITCFVLSTARTCTSEACSCCFTPVSTCSIDPQPGTAELYIYHLLIVPIKARQDGDPRSEDYDPGMLQQQQQLQHQSM